MATMKAVNGMADMTQEQWSALKLHYNPTKAALQQCKAVAFDQVNIANFEALALKSAGKMAYTMRFDHASDAQLFRKFTTTQCSDQWVIVNAFSGDSEKGILEVDYQYQNLVAVHYDTLGNKFLCCIAVADIVRFMRNDFLGRKFFIENFAQITYDEDQAIRDIVAGFICYAKDDYKQYMDEEGYDVYHLDKFNMVNLCYINQLVTGFYKCNKTMLEHFIYKANIDMQTVGFLLYCCYVGHGVGFFDYNVESAKAIQQWINKDKMRWGLGQVSDDGEYFALEGIDYFMRVK